MKKFFIILFLLLYIPTAYAIPLQEIKEVVSNDYSLGNEGRLFIPSQGVTIKLYSVKSHGDGNNAKYYVDNSDSGAYCLSFDGGCGYIADHWNQGFINIKNCQIGDYAYIKTENELRCFQCVKNTNGYNRETYLITEDGETLKNIDWADFCCYTCNGYWENVFMVFFKEIK